MHEEILMMMIIIIIMMSTEGVCYRICQPGVHTLAAMGLLWALEKGAAATMMRLIIICDAARQYLLIRTIISTHTC
jgi:poly-beta-hydroxyalkanoate depolymerase